MKRTEIFARMLAVVMPGLMVVVLAALSACTNAIDEAPGIPIPKEASKRQVAGDLAPGDVISVSYAGAPEMDLTQKVRADGRVSLPMVGEVRAAGRSLSSFQHSLASLYSKHLQEPKVVVTMVSAAASVYVSGEVGRPGKVSLDRPLTALEAIMECGGFKPTADSRKVSVVRTVNGSHRRYNLDMTAAMTGRARAFYLKPYDVIHVGQRMW